MLYYCYGDIHYRKTIGRTLLRLSFLRADQHKVFFMGECAQRRMGGHYELSYNRFSENSLFLVTGGAGFIGSNLAEALLNMGHRGRVLDNLSTEYAKNIAGLRENPKFEFVEGDIRDAALCNRVCKGADYVPHQAAVGVPESIEQPVEYTLTNIVGTVSMMEAAAKKA